MSKHWYAYVGGLSGDPRLPANYTLTNVKPACNGGKNICAIYSEGGDISPATPLSLNLLLYLGNSIISGVPEPQSPNEKKFVYLIT